MTDDNDDKCSTCGIDMRERPEHVEGDCRDFHVEHTLRILIATAIEDRRAEFLEALNGSPEVRAHTAAALHNNREAIGQYVAHLTGEYTLAWAKLMQKF